jgi:hypothetical protein
VDQQHGQSSVDNLQQSFSVGVAVKRILKFGSLVRINVADVKGLSQWQSAFWIYASANKALPTSGARNFYPLFKADNFLP